MNGRFLETLVDGISEALVSWTAFGEITTWNRAAEKLLGYASDEVVGRNVALLVPVERLAEHESVMAHITHSGDSAQIATARRHASGDLVDLSMSLSRICDDDGRLLGVGCVLRPLSDTAQLIDRLRRRVHTDPLTGAFNRAGVEELLASPDHRRARGHQAVMFIDLDGFKQVNDQAGHRQGDQLLRRCAARIRASIPQGHAVARWGGDEFVVVLEGLPTSEPAARRAVEKTCRTLIDALKLPYQLGPRRYRCPASIGVCLYQPANTSGAIALEAADQAMYMVKGDGKNAYRFGSPALDETLSGFVSPLVLAVQRQG